MEVGVGQAEELAAGAVERGRWQVCLRQECSPTGHWRESAKKGGGHFLGQDRMGVDNIGPRQFMWLTDDLLDMVGELLMPSRLRAHGRDSCGRPSST